MVRTVDSSVTSAPTFELEGKLRECEQCGTPYYNSVEWAKYCSKACKQVAYRLRKGIDPPNFLKAGVAIEIPYNTEPPTVIKPPKVISIPSSAATLAYKEQEQTVRKISNEVDQLERRLAARQKVLVDAENKDPHHTAYVITTFASIAIIIIFLGSSHLVNRRFFKGRKDDSQQSYVIAIIVSIVLVLVINLLARGNGAKQRRSLGKATEIKDITEQIRKLREQIEQTKSTLIFAKQTLEILRASLPESVDVPGSKHTNKVFDSIPTESNATVLTASELRARLFDLMTIREEYQKLFGQPERGFAMAVHGPPGEGKSTFVINLAYTLAVDNGTGIYFTAEEGFSQSMKAKIATFESDALLISDHRTLEGIEKALQQANYSVVVLDSIQQIGIKADQLRVLREQYPFTSFIYILQARKDKNFKGDNRFAHDADIEIKLDGFVPYRIKSRFV